MKKLVVICTIIFFIQGSLYSMEEAHVLTIELQTFNPDTTITKNLPVMPSNIPTGSQTSKYIISNPPYDAEILLSEPISLNDISFSWSISKHGTDTIYGNANVSAKMVTIFTDYDKNSHTIMAKLNVSANQNKK